ncbi:MSHA biogenesis protein MshM [Campylobacter concisus UNSWCS]|uniref:MSHA biogenesis protein MshM n=1 Tax=Campylobacter concisus UNSWCS TaxID=1242968 RepID=U2F2P2_9BACT|nr:ATP-binding protein [Campylobacter concisus]ERJ30771.1 MSHA biogenesis protein MshM [Campylobacter concisus UNSWCS]
MSNENIYTHIKDVFIDEDESLNFVNLDNSISCYNKIVLALKKSLKLILFYGKPGSGKTFLLNKIANDLKEDKSLIFFPHPFFSEATFIEALCEQIYGKKLEDINNFESFIKFYSKDFSSKDEILKNQMTVILDEAQLYPTELIEKIRLMADTRMFKFLFTIHKTENEDILAKDYFQTRIWESIELSSADVNEIIIYLQRKLSQKNYDKYLKFDKKDYECAYSFCGGNLRTLNKIMYKFYEICEYYEQYQPSKLSGDKANIMILTMAALDAGLIDA